MLHCPPCASRSHPVVPIISRRRHIEGRDGWKRWGCNNRRNAECESRTCRQPGYPKEGSNYRTQASSPIKIDGTSERSRATQILEAAIAGLQIALAGLTHRAASVIQNVQVFTGLSGYIPKGCLIESGCSKNSTLLYYNGSQTRVHAKMGNPPHRKHHSVSGGAIFDSLRRIRSTYLPLIVLTLSQQ
jgi:hypothetical protein